MYFLGTENHNLGKYAAITNPSKNTPRPGENWQRCKVVCWGLNVWAVSGLSNASRAENNKLLRCTTRSINIAIFTPSNKILVQQGLIKIS